MASRTQGQRLIAVGDQGHSSELWLLAGEPSAAIRVLDGSNVEEHYGF
jgi:hypothetical protein